MEAFPEAVPGEVTPGRWFSLRNEYSRTYRFPNGDTVEVLDGQMLFVSARDTHYIRDGHGALHIIRNTWLSVHITEMEDPR